MGRGQDWDGSSGMNSWLDEYDKSKGWSSPWNGSSSTGYQSATYKRCYEDHPDLELGGGVITGRSCMSPKPGYDVYIGLDSGMSRQAWVNPWSKEEAANVVEGCYPIIDRCAPKDPEEFKDMITWMQEQLAKGRRIHVGCLGGHGRTGTVLAALVAKVLKEKDAIQWVREHHCKKAVETNDQVRFLMKHFGCLKAEPSKPDLAPMSGQYSRYPKVTSKREQSKVTHLQSGDEIFRHVLTKASIW